MSASATSPSALEEGRAPKVQHSTTTHHHHHHHASKRLKHLAHLRHRNRETKKLQSKLPPLLASDGADLKTLRRRLVVKNEIVAALAEFCGTFLFLFFAFGIATQAGQQQLSQSSQGGTQSAGTLDTSQLLFSSLGFGFSLAVNAWVFFRVSGGLFNPAVTLGLFLCGALTWYRSIILFVVQFVAAIAAAGIAQLVIAGGINARTKLGDNTTLAQGFFIEMFCTSLLMLTIYMLAGEKHKATYLAPIGIGLALFLAELFATGLTGGSLNPARSLGPDVIAAQFDSSAWIYYTAPFVGTLLSALVYWGLKVSRYETANEGQDGDDTGALVLRDVRGNVTGAVQRVDAADAPQIPGLNGTTRPPSIISVTEHGTDGIMTGAIPSRAPSIVGNDAGESLQPPTGIWETPFGGNSGLIESDAQQWAEKEKMNQPGMSVLDFSKEKTS